MKPDQEILLNMLLDKNYHSLTKRKIVDLILVGMKDAFSGAN